MQDFLKALEEVKPQFGVDEEKFVAYFREKITNYGPGYDRVMSSLRELAVMNPSQKNQKRSVLLAGR